ncbi:biopolymer transporter ExbD [Pacificimonas flava]|uniref:Biopolymer transporter ExbD n=2 Tax=Pacificimonas TaxID=1960290 RepID=A0A219B8I9_9SPHN|nr:MULTISPECIES: biopolymer transporter ExbD [Pacificimonas]MBZ6379923.1 biopolymer transporter ExbD [Pacificimonas aurantium]OWV34446.1 biopolymer transporter ExbD [Pacificimonas flava]
MAISMGSTGGDAPMVEMNTTPLIDVMLVLLIMFIITIPIQTHAVKLDLPVDSQDPPPEDVVDPVINRIRVDFLNEIYWNDQQVSPSQLEAYFRQSADMDPEPEIHIRPDALARYSVVSEIMASASRNGVTKIGFVGNEAYASLQ